MKGISFWFITEKSKLVVHPTPEEFENGGFTPKTDASNVFRPHYAGEIWKTKQSPVILNLSLRKTREGKSLDYRDAIVFEKLRFQNVFRPNKNAKPAFSNSSGLKSVLEKLRFRDGLVWTVGLTGEIKLLFKIPLRVVDRA